MTIPDLQKKEFKNWLVSKSYASDRVSIDIASRLKRVSKWTRIGINKSEIETVDNMIEKSGLVLSGPVKSQLRKATRLYIQFITEFNI